MGRIASLQSLVLAILFGALAWSGVQRVSAAQAKPAGLAAVLAQMNEASAKFASAQADLRQELFTKALNDTDTQTGQVYFLHKAGTTQMGMKLLASDAKPGAAPAQIIEFKDGKAQVLNTGTGQVDVFSTTGKNQAFADTMMTLGFGGTGTDLQKAWIVTDQGPETLKDGNQPVQTEQLDLVSRDPKIKNTFSHITIWVDPARDVSLKQTLFEASDGKSTGDTRTAYFYNLRLNQNVDVAPFAIKCKGKCNVVQH
jgi:hypothetical protein